FGVVRKGKANLPAEVSDALFKLKKGQVSEVIETPTDYYIVKALDVVDKNNVKVAIIRIKVKDIASYLEEFRKDGEVKEYITLDDVSSQKVN
ncbi:peptidyl-prolyl cis-trans isomerase, partial [Candidatus Saccharibacteria bacterium]|nr:peptidyl-prolyl cis-trans isomerase [Candidatus Saccharibacteria bacterium]